MTFDLPEQETDWKQLPWSTSNEDLVELFTTIGKVERAEIQYELNGRSRGTGVVQFDSTENAETAIGKFSPMTLGTLTLTLNSQVHGISIRRTPAWSHIRQVLERRCYG